MILPQDVRALVIDDNAYARAAVAATLRKLGLLAIDELPGAAAAVGAIQATRYDIVFMDWYMPEMSGAALLEVIRDPRFSANGQKNGQVPVVMITAYPNRDTIARARELGASEVLTKPFSVAHAAAALGRLLPSGWQIPDEPVGQVLL